MRFSRVLGAPVLVVAAMAALVSPGALAQDCLPFPGYVYITDGATNFVQIEDDPALDFQHAATIEGWFRISSITGAVLLSKGDGLEADSDRAFDIGIGYHVPSAQTPRSAAAPISTTTAS